MFTAEERERIAAAVKEAEQHTSGEIVPCIVAQCDEYEEAGWRGGAAAAFLAFAAFFCLRSFPTNLTAMIFGHHPKPSFAVENEAEISKAPKVDFGK